RLAYTPFAFGICGQFLRQLHGHITGPFHSLLTFLPWLVKALRRRRTLGNFLGSTPAKSLPSAAGCLSCDLFAGVLIGLVAGVWLIILAVALALLVFFLAPFLGTVLSASPLLHIFASFSV